MTIKKSALLFLLIFYSFCVAAQQSTTRTVSKFIQYYKTDQIDSIYSLFNSNMKDAINQEGTKTLILDIKTQLGNVIEPIQEGGTAGQIERYRLSFEKPLDDVMLFLQDGLIAGIRQVPVKPTDSDVLLKESPDNYFITEEGTIYGTLRLPENTSAKVPVVLLIGGSGPTDRNMNSSLGFRSDSFFMLARDLATKGIASVRFDKRGVGKSNAARRSNQVSLDDFINDAVLFIKKLKADSRFSKVIVLGHSEGSVIGLVSVQKELAGALISLCGPADDLGVIMKRQLKARLTDSDFKVASEILDSLNSGIILKRKLPGSLAGMFSLDNQFFLISSIKYHSTVEIGKLKLPLLVIGGDTDLQVDIDQAKKLANANPNVNLKLISNMNHVLKNAPIDRQLNLGTYGNPRLPIHGQLVPIISGFINSLN